MMDVFLSILGLEVIQQENPMYWLALANSILLDAKNL